MNAHHHDNPRIPGIVPASKVRTLRTKAVLPKGMRKVSNAEIGLEQLEQELQTAFEDEQVAKAIEQAAAKHRA
jgi:hypothetical protein